MRKPYTVIRPAEIDGRQREAGEPVNLTDKQAEFLRLAGFIEPATTIKKTKKDSEE